MGNKEQNTNVKQKCRNIPTVVFNHPVSTLVKALNLISCHH